MSAIDNVLEVVSLAVLIIICLGGLVVLGSIVYTLVELAWKDYKDFHGKK